MAKQQKEEWQEVKSNWVGFNVIGDHVIGTLVSVREMKSTLPDRGDEMVKVYEIKADSGEYHNLDDKKKVIEEAIVVEEGYICNVGGGSKEKPNILDGQFRKIKLGQKVKIEYVDDKPAKQKGYNPMKVKKVFTNGKMDEEWLKEQEEARKAVNTGDDF